MATKKIIPKLSKIAKPTETKKDIKKKVKTAQSDFTKIQKKYTKSARVLIAKSTSSVKFKSIVIAIDDPENLYTKKFNDQLISIVKLAHKHWRLQAFFNSITVNAISALGAPGCLDGPALISFENKIRFLNKIIGTRQQFARAVLTGVSDQFTLWQDAVTVPNLPWYPSFAVFPGPMAPPTPNIPIPIIACASNQIAKIVVPSELDNAIQSHLPAALKRTMNESFMHLLTVKLSLYFNAWLVSQLVQRVMGSGPVPHFAPPYVPTGSVINGSASAAPGHLAI